MRPGGERRCECEVHRAPRLPGRAAPWPRSARTHRAPACRTSRSFSYKLRQNGVGNRHPERHIAASDCRPEGIVTARFAIPAGMEEARRHASRIFRMDLYRRVSTPHRTGGEGRARIAPGAARQGVSAGCRASGRMPGAPVTVTPSASRPSAVHATAPAPMMLGERSISVGQNLIIVATCYKRICFLYAFRFIYGDKSPDPGGASVPSEVFRPETGGSPGCSAVPGIPEPRPAQAGTVSRLEVTRPASSSAAPRRAGTALPPGGYHGHHDRAPSQKLDARCRSWTGRLRTGPPRPPAFRHRREREIDLWRLETR